MAESGPRGEEEIVQGYFAPLAAGFPGAFGLADDGAAIPVAAGHDLIVTTDPIVAGVHFLAGDEPAAIGWKALAVNVSDLVAKGATPLAYTMAVAFPERPRDRWLAAFARGLADAQSAFGCHLAGGDTDHTPGPLSVAITAFGTLPAGTMVRRNTAQPGDSVYVTGTIGDAALGLGLRRDPSRARTWRLSDAHREALEKHSLAPRPPIGFESVLREYASAAIDISDGLAKDFERLCRASGVAGALVLERRAFSDAARAVIDAGGVTEAELVAGGEDYRVLLTVSPRSDATRQRLRQAAEAHGIPLIPIGTVNEACAGVSPVTICVGCGPDHRRLDLARTGWDHF